MSGQSTEDNTIRATARLPGLDIEIIHRRSLNDKAEQISINLQAMPSFEAFGRFLETANPFALWAQIAQMAWLPWLNAARLVTLPLPNINFMLPELSSNRNPASHQPGRDTRHWKRQGDAEFLWQYRSNGQWRLEELSPQRFPIGLCF